MLCAHPGAVFPVHVLWVCPMSAIRVCRASTGSAPCLWGVSSACLLSSSACVCVSVSVQGPGPSALAAGGVCIRSVGWWLQCVSCRVGLYFAAGSGLLSLSGLAACPAGLHLCWCFQGGGGARCVPREAAGIPSDTPSGLCAEWRLRLRCVPLPAGATLARGWLWRAGRAGAVVGTGPEPGPRYKYPGCRRLCLLGPSPGAGAVAAGQVLGAGVTRPQRRHFLLARQATASLPLPG